MNDSASRKKRSRKRSRKSETSSQNIFQRFIQSWSKLSNNLALEYFGCDLSRENQKLHFVLILGWVISFSAFYGMILRPVQALSWQQTQGKLVERKLVGRLGRYESRKLLVKYSFVTNGEPQIGSRIDFAHFRGSAYSWIPEVGKNVTVYFDPAAPENSVLDRSPPWTGLCVSFCLLSIFTFFSIGAVHTALSQTS